MYRYMNRRTFRFALHMANSGSGAAWCQEWFAIDQPNSRFAAQTQHVFSPFYRARVLDTATGNYIGLANYKAPRRSMSGILTGCSSVQRTVKYGIQHELCRK